MSFTKPAFKHPLSFCLASALLIAGLAACGGGSDDEADPLRQYREQTVEWTACDPTILGREEDWGDDIDEDDDIDLSLDDAPQRYGHRLRCALVRAPLDWARPERGDVAISVMRLAAGKPEQRRGALVFNPGGPGIDGLAMAFVLANAFADSAPEDPQGALQLRLLDEYDMVGYSPRGVGASTRFECATNELRRVVDLSPTGWDTPENLANAQYNGRKQAEACLKNPLAPFINTDASARDLDLLRHLLGENRLNYVGISYGTLLGAWYASLFPDRVGRMVLDSSLDYAAPFEESERAQPLALQRLIDELLVPYAVRHAAHFQLGTTEATVRAQVPGLSPRMQRVLIDHLPGLGYQRQSADRLLDTIAAARGLDAVLESAPDPSDQDALQQALRQQVFDPTDPQHDRLVREAAQGLLASYVSTWIAPPVPTSISLSPGTAVYHATNCNDPAWTTDLGAWIDRVREIAPRAPMVVADGLDFTCAFWGGPRVVKPDPAAMKPLNILFVQSQYDMPTPIEGANAMFARLPAAQRIYVPGEFQHGVYPYLDRCVDPAVTRYLLGESPAQRETSCPAHPLPRDAQLPATAAAAQEQAASMASTRAIDSSSSVYRHPERARQLIEQFKETTAPPRRWR